MEEMSYILSLKRQYSVCIKLSEGQMEDSQYWSDRRNVIHTFYKKSVSSMYTIMRRSAIAGNWEKLTLFQECLRRINNIYENFLWTETVQNLSEFSYCMKISGYDKIDRWNSIKGSILRKEDMLRKVESGEIESIYRGKSEILRSKIEKRGLKSASWYLKGKIYHVIPLSAKSTRNPGKKLTGSIEKVKS